MGGQTGKGGQVNKSSAENGLLAVATNLINESGPLRSEVLRQTMESLSTGGVGARLPIVQKGIEASRAATSSALSQLDESMARSGTGRGSIADVLRASTLQQGELATQAIPQEVASQLIGVAPTLTLGFSGQGLQGYGAATGAANQRMGISAQRDIAKGNQQTEMIKSVMSVAGAAAMGCWIAGRLYGWYTPEWIAARYYIYFVWQGRVARLARRAYLRWGERVARSTVACWLLRPLFDVAVRRGLEALRGRR